MKDLIRKMFNVEKFSDLNKIDRNNLSDLYYNEKFDEREISRFWKLLEEDERLLPKRSNFTEEEIAYRRGYSHGVAHALLGKVTNEDVREWISSGRLTGAPGTNFENVEMLGLVKDEEIASFDKLMPR